MKSIVQFVTQLALESNLPFEVDISPDPDCVALRTEQVGKYAFPMYGEYTAGEQFFVEGINGKNSTRNLELQVVMQSISKQMREFFGIKQGDTQQLQAVYLQVIGADPQPDLAPKENAKSTALAAVIPKKKIEQFQADNEDLLSKLLTLSMQTSGNTVATIFLVTYFMRSRVSGEWDFSNTQRLKSSELNRIAELIREDGMGAQPEATTDSPSEVITAGKEGKQPSPKPEPVEQTGLESIPTFVAA
jgi:hypothetical protein